MRYLNRAYKEQYYHSYIQLLLSYYTRAQWTPLADLMHERLEHLLRPGDGNHAGGAHIVNAVVEVVDAAGICDLLTGDFGALHEKGRE